MTQHYTPSLLSPTAAKVALAFVLALAPSLSAFAQSARPGIGATPFFTPVPAGTTFRVWAPNATAVRVAGTFNAWNATSHPLVSEGNGYWSLDVNFVYAGAIRRRQVCSNWESRSLESATRRPRD